MLMAGHKVMHRPTYTKERMQATVIYIHPEERFAVLEYDLSTTGVMGERLERKVRECCWLAKRRRG